MVRSRGESDGGEERCRANLQLIQSEWLLNSPEPDIPCGDGLRAANGSNHNRTAALLPHSGRRPEARDADSSYRRTAPRLT